MANNTSSSLSYALDEVVGAAVFEMFYEEPYLWPQLYNVRTSGKRRERTASFGGLGEFTQKNPTQAPDTDTMVQQFEKNFVHTAYAKQINIERELIDDSDWGIVAEFGIEVGRMASYTIEHHAAGVFLDAFAGATHTAEDSLAICYSAHVNADSGNSQANAGTSALSMASVKSTRTAMKNFTNYNGELAGIRPNALLVPHDIEEDAWEIVNSTGRVDTANRAQNFYQGQFTLFVWDFLSTAISGGDADNWFMLDTRKMARNLIWYQRVPLEVFSDGDLFSGTKKIGAYMRYSYGVRDWRWIYGHNV